MQLQPTGFASNQGNLPAVQRLRQWWRRQAPARQDRYATLAPLLAVLLFLAAIVAAFGYLRLEEMEREQEAVRHDLEYTQQRMRLSLIERREELARLAKEINDRPSELGYFKSQADAYLRQHPEMDSLTWLNERGLVKASVIDQKLPRTPSRLSEKPEDKNFVLARDLRQAIFDLSPASTEQEATVEIYIPLSDKARFTGVLLAEISVEVLYRQVVPSELTARYAISLLDGNHSMLAGRSFPKLNPAARLLPWARQSIEYEMPVAPVGNALIIRAQGYRTSLGLIGNGLFWLVITLSAISAWMLIANWQHTRRRMQAQQALVAETNFRRAMENSMPTGMRALDLKGQITYVNTAFCQMTGWSESELVGANPPFPYWPDEDREMLMTWLDDELNGRITPGGFQVRVKRKDGSIFDARLYVSPLIDALGQQTGWMTSMTDITEPNRVREQLFASYERFTTVLDGLDASVSVAPATTQERPDELLFANTRFKEWYGEGIEGHLLMAAHVNEAPGLDAGRGAEFEAELTEIYVEPLGKWLELRTRLLTWVDGRMAQMVIASDITPRRMAEEQAAVQAERAQAASRLVTMGEMASSVAHELNQPLTAISNYCTGMVSRLRLHRISEQDLIDTLEKTSRQAQRAGQIIQRIQSFVKRSAPNRTLADVATMVEEAMDLAQIGLRRHSVRLTHQADPALPPLMVDPILIEQVLVNLLKNAAESVSQAKLPPEQRRVELNVQAAWMDEKAGIEFQVSDNGRGIPPEVMDRLFEAFHSTKTEGMGIGLSLCRSIVESHQGRMSARNLYNADGLTGCCFSFWIPLPAIVSQNSQPVEHRKDRIPG
ncbi:MAG: PAS domain S-box protein [Hylemonella sp.]